MLRIRHTLLLIVLIAHAAATQPIDPAVEATMKKELKDKKIPGAVMGVVDRGTITCLIAAGTANTETGETVTTDMLFRLGSTTKMFVAMAALLAAHDGRLDLRTPVGEYLPDVTPALRVVTLQQILTHTAGIQDEAPMFGPDDDGALAREISSWTDERRFLEPGESFSYSNPGYWLAGRILEVVDKKPFADVIRDRILRPVGMTRSTFRPEEAARYPLSAPHDRDQNVVSPAPNHAGTWPSGSLYSSVPELLRFASAIINGGMLDGKRVFPSSVVRTFLTPQVPIDARPGVRYGYGLMHQMYRGMRDAFHTGARIGFGSIIDFSPDSNVAVVVIGNRTGSLLTSTIRAGYATRLELGPLDEEDFSGGDYITDPSKMTPFLGMYVNNPGIAELEIYNRSALPLIRVGEIMTLRKGKERIPLRILNDSTATNGFQWLTFTRSQDGTIRLLHYDVYTLKRTGQH